MPTLTDNQYQTLAAMYGPGLSLSDMLYKYRGNGNVKSLSDLNYTAWLGDAVKSFSDNKYNKLAGSGSMSDKSYATSDGGIIASRVNLATNPGYESGTNSFFSNSGAQNTFSADTTAPIAGTKSALYTRTTTSLTANIATPLCTATDLTSKIPVTAGQPITAGISVKTDVANATMSVRWYWYDASAVLTAQTPTVIVNGNAIPNQVYRLVNTSTPPAGTVTAYFLVNVYQLGNCVGGERVWADQLTLENGTTDGSWFGAYAGGLLVFPSQASCDVLSTELPTFTITPQSTTTIAGGVLTGPATTTKYRGAAGFAFGTPFPLTTVYAPNSRYNNSYATPNNCGESFMHTGTEFEILYYLVNTSGSIRIRIDGKRVSPLPIVTAGVSAGGRFVWKVTFSTNATRRIDIDHNYHHFGGVFLGAGNTIAAVPTPSVRCLLFGDSITNGSNSTTGLANGTWKQLFDKYCGIDDIWDIAIGGTGYSNRGASPGTTTEALTARLADFQNYSPNVLIVWAGYNDFSIDDVTFRAAVQTVFNAVAAMPAACEKYIWGHWSPTVVQSATYVRHDQILREEAAARALPIWMPATGICYSKTGTQLASTQPIIRDATDVTNCIQADAVHPTDAGNTRIAQVGQLAMQILTGVS